MLNHTERYVHLRNSILSRHFALSRFGRINFVANGASWGSFEPARDLRWMVRIKEVRCHKTEDNGEDELRLIIGVDDGLRPVVRNEHMNDNDDKSKNTWTIGSCYKFRDHVTIEVWDEDSPDADDLLGSVSIGPGTVIDRVTKFGNNCSYEMSYDVVALDPPEIGCATDVADAGVVGTAPGSPNPSEANRWAIALHGRENPLIATGHLLICLAVEAYLGNSEAVKIIKCALESLNSLFKFRGNHFDGYIVRFDDACSDLWATEEANGKIISRQCLDFLRDDRKNTLYCTPFDHPDYIRAPPDGDPQSTRDVPGPLDRERWNFCLRYRHWEPSMDELNGLLMGYDLVYRLVRDKEVRNTIRAHVAKIGDYLAEHGYFMVRPGGGFTARGAAGVLPALEVPFGEIFLRITGDRYRARCGFTGAVKQAGMWEDLRAPLYAGSAIGIAAQIGLTATGINGLLLGFLGPLGFTGTLLAGLSLPVLARAALIYVNKGLFDLKGSLTFGGGAEARQEVAVGYIMSQVPRHPRFSAYMEGAARGMGGFARSFPKYFSLAAVDIPASNFIDRGVRDLCLDYLDRYKPKDDELQYEMVFQKAVRALLGRTPDRDAELASELDRVYQLFSSSWNGNLRTSPTGESTGEALCYMSALSLAWLYQSLHGAKPNLPSLPAPGSFAAWPAPAVPAEVLAHATEPEPRLFQVPLHAIQRGRTGANLRLDKNGNAPLFLFDDIPPGKEGVVWIDSPPRIPNAPFGLSASKSQFGVTSGRVHLFWMVSSLGDKGYDIERRSDRSPSWLKVATIAAHVPSTEGANYVDTAPLDDVYHYRVRAGNDAGYSPYSAELDVDLRTTEVPVVTGLLKGGASNKLSHAHLLSKFTGKGTWVWRQNPDPDTRVLYDSTVTMQLQPGEPE
jgi:hypothetical protein